MKKLLLGTAIAAAALSSHSFAEVSATAGFVSDYYFRGANLGDGGAYGSVDYTSGGFYAGTWAIDDGMGSNDGLEYDIYLGYGQESDSFSWNVGYNRYEYTYDSIFQHEIDITLGFSGFTFDLILGEDDPNVEGSEAEDYTVIILGYSHGAFGVEIGTYDNDNEDPDATATPPVAGTPNRNYDWAQVSFSGELVEGIDASINLGVSSDEEGLATDDGYMYLDFSKSFEL